MEIPSAIAGSSTTVTLHTPKRSLPATCALISVVPSDLPVTLPFASTDAISILSLLQFTNLLEASAGIISAVRFTTPVIVSFTSSGFIDTDSTGTSTTLTFTSVLTFPDACTVIVAVPGEIPKIKPRLFTCATAELLE